MKNCTKCKKEKEDADFYKKGNRNTSYCKICFNIYCMQRWKQTKKKAVVYKGSKCNDCPITYPEYSFHIFDFHHLDPNTKDMDWKKLRQCAWDKITNELDKCILLCANCHRLRHSDVD